MNRKKLLCWSFIILLSNVQNWVSWEGKPKFNTCSRPSRNGLSIVFTYDRIWLVKPIKIYKNIIN